MNSNAYLAHIAEDGRQQSLLAHLRGTAALAADFASAFGQEALGELCGLAHDLGKYSEAFQARLRGASQRVDHSTAGCKELLRAEQVHCAFCVAGHHAGLPNGGNRKDSGDESSLLGRMHKPIEVYERWKEELSLPAPAAPTQTDPLRNAMLTRMFYSCLVDADFLDTEAFMQGGCFSRPAAQTPAALLEMLNAHIEKEGLLRPQNTINTLRAQVLRTCISKAADQPGLFSLTVPTGGGKTLSSLAFALNHAVIHKMARIIYVIPYCSIIEQTAAVFRKIFGEEAVLEHHSGAAYDGDDDCLTERERKRRLAAENWDAPIVVTTSVQFYESLYANRSSKCRKLHNIANSVIIFDEAQMLPIPCLKPCVSAIALLAEQYRSTALLCTATQPALDDLFQKLCPGLTRREICPDTAQLYEANRRVQFYQAGKLENADLAQQLQSHKQVLCIVNSRKQAQAVFALLRDEGNIHLSTLMIPAHRAQWIAEIRRRLQAGQTCRVVSTSLIEAGVDVDFPAVYREEAGLDSILQAAGRCNREGRRRASDSIVTIFRSETAAPPIFAPNIGATREIMPFFPDIASSEAVHAYFQALLSLKGDAALDKFGVLEAFARETYPFRDVAERFSLIDSGTKTVYIPVEEGQALCEQLQSGALSRNLFRKLGQYGVTVYPNHFAALLRAGDITPFGEDAAILTNSELYNKHSGLFLTADEGKAIMV
ncbi:MAG: CRISPR-associated helicase Cas3' [Oscillospiraceae bacterium]|jgi:CRISPR-associated endonuclease/helicase Cas3|nr:CRISPR-associated helicase Cas3' [Oscillospiraceae bacterium]